MNILEVEDLHVRYGSYEAVKGVSFALAKGEILGIVGESGSGKSTVAKALMGLERPSAGRILLPVGEDGNRAGKAAGGRRPSLQMVFQDAVGSLSPRMTVRQTLSEVLRVRRSSARTVQQLLDCVGLSPAVLNQCPREMSGGQCQRVSVARALACEPDILIADEPVSALDVSVQARVLNLLRDLRGDLGLSILLIAHDLAVVKNICDRICVMERGRCVEAGPAADVFEHPASDYTRRLLQAVPTL